MPIPTELFATITERLLRSDGPATVGNALAMWNTLFDKFAPLLGPLGTKLIFTRSLAIQAAAFPWLPQLPASESQDTFGAYERSLHGLTPDELVTVNVALLGTYTTLLADMIGEKLATRLLGSTFPEDRTDKNSLENTA